MEPKEVSLGDEEIHILWDDGHNSFYPHRYLRGECRCAACVEEMTGRRVVGWEDVREDVHALDWMRVGRYAVQFLWNDLHDSGIYTFTMLRQLCRCRECSEGEVEKGQVAQE